MKIVHLEDNPADAELIHAMIAGEWPDCVMRQVSTEEAFARELADREPCDLILSDFSMAHYSGLEALKLARQRLPDTPFVFLSGTIGEDRAIEALQGGAQDYILKDRMKRLISAIHRVMRDRDSQKVRQQAERLVREQAEMLNQAHEAILITDLEDRIIYWNSGAARLFRWTAAEAQGRLIAQLFPEGDDAAKFQAVWAEAARQDEWRGELHVRNRCGIALVLEMRQSRILDERGERKARLSICGDITERKRLEEQFLRAQRLENIGLLAAGIAHDLNNMLAPIAMGVPLLRDFVADPAGIKLLDTLESSAERGVGLVRQILGFAHGVNGEMQLMQVRHLLHDLVRFIHATFPKDIRLEEDIPAGLWPVNANATQLHQVVLNLCVNARDAMPAGGTLRLKAENVELGPVAAGAIEGGRPGSYLMLRVEDTGSGIAPEVAARMWEPFFTTKEIGKGTGLGLSTVRGIVSNHGGFLQLWTEVGKGTAFTLYLPADTGGTQQRPTQPSAQLRGNGEVILIVDDEETIRDMVATVLTRHGYRVQVASDGIDALILYAKHFKDVRLVVSDVQMPNLDGVAMSRLLKRINPDVRMLLVSGAASAGLLKKARESAGFNTQVVNKPFIVEQLLARVHEAIHAAVPPSSAPAE
ncbi:MAG: response regulator [Verrucomicrobia bacterium]|nr:response regulator [Verrucomicrobiota bacterium]